MPAWKRVGDSDLPVLVTDEPAEPVEPQDSEPETQAKREPSKAPRQRKRAQRREPEN